ncbi:hypothetical protein pb186bvf_015278 [Paramecium bursaria]
MKKGIIMIQKTLREIIFILIIIYEYFILCNQNFVRINDYFLIIILGGRLHQHFSSNLLIAIQAFPFCSQLNRQKQQ